MRDLCVFHVRLHHELALSSDNIFRENDQARSKRISYNRVMGMVDMKINIFNGYTSHQSF